MATGLYSLSLCSVGFICCSTSKLTLIQLLHVCTCAQLCPTLCNRIDCSLPDFSVHGIFQAGILEQVDISYPGITLASLVLAGGFFTTVPPGSPRATSNSPLILQLPYLYNLKRNVFSIKSSIANQIPHFPSKLLSHLFLTSR